MEKERNNREGRQELQNRITGLKISIMGSTLIKNDTRIIKDNTCIINDNTCIINDNACIINDTCIIYIKLMTWIGLYLYCAYM